MSDEIIKILDDLGQRFGIAIDWSSENVMPYLKDLMSRFINYEMITSVVWMVVFIICCTLMFIAIKKLIQYQKSHNKTCSHYEEIIWPTITSVIFVFLIVFCLIGISCQINDLILCNTIPERLIINYINTLMV